MIERIAVNPRIHFGKPCVSGKRIPVQSVLEIVREGLSFAEIIRDYYPDLEPEDIRACIQYAIDVVAIEDIHLCRHHEIPHRRQRTVGRGQGFRLKPVPFSPGTLAESQKTSYVLAMRLALRADDPRGGASV